VITALFRSSVIPKTLLEVIFEDLADVSQRWIWRALTGYAAKYGTAARDSLT
jgi:hypothetical protein